MISIVINCDTRPGCGADVSTTGDHGEGSLHGVRSWDFLTDGVTNKLNFFRGQEVELILFIDQHEPLPLFVEDRIHHICRNLPAKVICRENPRRINRWNEMLYIEALKLATGDYIAHFDGDCAAFRSETDPVNVIEDHLGMLDARPPVGAKFVCQPTTLTPEEHGMDWASTRFFICKGSWLNLDEAERCVTDEAYRIGKYGHTPALEHVFGKMAGETGVFYPPANWDRYMVFSWSRYHRGLLAKLNTMPYEQVRDYILDCGIHGPNDVISKPL